MSVNENNSVTVHFPSINIGKNNKKVTIRDTKAGKERVNLCESSFRTPVTAPHQNLWSSADQYYDPNSFDPNSVTIVSTSYHLRISSTPAYHAPTTSPAQSIENSTVNPPVTQLSAAQNSSTFGQIMNAVADAHHPVPASTSENPVRALHRRPC